jgi:hypothetical protein
MTTSNDHTTKAFEFAQDLTKLLMTLATGIVTITITFLTDVSPKAPAAAHTAIQIAWVLYVLSIPAGIFALMGMTASLADTKTAPLITDSSITWPARVQFLLFFLALVATITFGIAAL